MIIPHVLVKCHKEYVYMQIYILGGKECFYFFLQLTFPKNYSAFTLVKKKTNLGF